MSNNIDSNQSTGQNTHDHDSQHKKRKSSKKRILTLVLAALLLIGIGGGYLLSSAAGLFSSAAQVTITFDSTGGSEVDSRTVAKGEKLTDVDVPVREGYVFAGWYYEQAPVNAYNQDDVFSENTTLHAAWYKPDMKVDRAEYIHDCASDITFVVDSDVVLTDDNLADYIRFSSVGNQDAKTLSVKRQDEHFVLYAKDGLTPGLTYSLALLDSNTVRFVKAGDKDVSGLGITSYQLTIFKENVNNVVMKVEPKLVSSDDVADFEVAGEAADGETGSESNSGKTIYRAALIRDGDFKAGDIISLGNGEQDAVENQYYRVLKVTNRDQGVLLDLISPNLEDIYSEYEIYYSGEAAYFEEDDEDTQALEQSLQTSLKQSEGYDYLCTAIAQSIKQSPTVLSTVSTLDAANQKRFEDLSISALKDLLKNVKIDIAFGKTKDIKNQDNGCYGRIYFSTGDINIKLDDNIKLTLNLSMTEDITSTVFGWQKIDKKLKFYVDSGVYMDNRFSMSFKAEIATTSGRVNITEEIQKLVNSDNKTDAIVNSLNNENLFGGDLDYVEVLSKELGKKTVTIFEVLSIQFTLDFKVSVGMRAGLDLNFSSAETRKIGMCNVDYTQAGARTDMKYYNERMKSELHFTATLKGKVGVRAGFEAGVNFSVVHLNDVFNLGFSAELGVYEEISGFLRFDYNYTHTNGQANSNMYLAGGLKSETGIYVELEFTWNVFGWDDGITIAEMKFPILTIGSLEFASEFEQPESTVGFNTKSYNIKSSGADLLKLKYIDIETSATGATINIKPAASTEDYAFFLAQDQSGKGGKDDLKYVSVDQNTGMVTIADNAPDRVDFTVVVQYTKGCSLFTQNLELITKNINMTYTKYQVDDVSKKYRATFLAPDGSIVAQNEYYVGQIPVPPAEDTYEDLVTFTKYRLVSWVKPWKEDIKAIYADTDYHLDCELNEKTITFYGTIYDQATDTYGYGVIAAVPTLVGELPVPPSPKDMAADWGYEFDSWSPALHPVDADAHYTAAYRQRDDMSLTSFYVGNTLIANEFVIKGTVPDAPDMSQYNTEEREFAGWRPSLHPGEDNWESYFAVFRQYVKVTFKDRDGKVLEEQRVLAGNVSKAPKVDDVVAGEDDYYAYHFSHWAAADGSRLDRVYKDTVYSPVYDTRYLEVTTVFDAGDHCFADGTKIKEFKGTYADYDFLYMPQLTYRDRQNTYTVDYWQSTQTVNGSYVKLNMSDFYTRYKYNLTFTPVFKPEPVVYTVIFGGGDKKVYLSGHHGDTITADMLTGLKKTSADVNYVYQLSDYGVTLPYRFGTIMGNDGLPDVTVGVTARFKLVGVDNTVTFDANGGKFADNQMVKTVTAPYGTRASFNETPVKSEDELYRYQFAGWADDKDAASGSHDNDFLMNGSKTLYAVYTKTPKNVTLTFYAGLGRFADGSTQKTLQLQSGEIAPAFDEMPAKEATEIWTYTFTGWSPVYQPGMVVDKSVSYYAQYSAQMKTYAVTFDAGEGRFDNGAQTLTQSYHYGDTIVPPDNPLREETEYFRYEFTGWAPPLPAGTTVSFERMFTATYRAIAKDAPLPESGITVTRDGVTEDIHVGSIAGYTYTMEENLAGAPLPTLTVTGNGLTFSGTSDKVCVIIAPGVTDVTFQNLTLAGAYSGLNAVLEAQEASEMLTLEILGDCAIRNTANDWLGVRLERPVTLKGGGAGAKLSLASKGNYTVYCACTFNVDTLELLISGTATALGGDDGTGGEWLFKDSAIQLDSDADACLIMSGIKLDHTSLTATGERGVACAGLVMAGASNADITAGSADDAALAAGVLSFEDFTGTFHAQGASGIAVMAFDAIRFKEHGAEVGASGYDLGGTEIGSFEHAGSGTTYFSFGVRADETLVPASAVTVTKP